jgi:glycosyltransferase involved in cell wall biosynthesis
MESTPQVQREGPPGEAPAAALEVAPRTCLLVLGMHRSGTSALTRVLSLLGAALPHDIMVPAPGNNEAGFWEPNRLVAWNDRILQALSSSWDDWRRLDLTTLDAATRSVLVEGLVDLIAAEYDDAPLFVLKDPRICRFVPLYAEALARLGVEPRFVLSIRNPLAVMRSLAVRDQIVDAYAALLWLRHMLDAEWATRGAPRTFVAYDTLLDDWRTTVARLVDAVIPDATSVLDASLASEINTFLSGGLRHHTPSQSDLVANRDVSNWLKDSYAALLRLVRDADEAAACATLDRVRDEFDAVAPMFAAASAEFGRRDAAQRVALQVALQALKDELAKFKRMVGQKDKALNALRDQAAVERQRAVHVEAELRRKAASLAGQLSKVTDRNQSLTANLSAAQQRVATLQEVRIALQQDIAIAGEEITQRDRQIARLGEELAAGDAQVADLSESAAQAARLLAIQAAELEGLRGELEQSVAELERTQATISWRLTAPLRKVRATLKRIHSLRRSTVALRPQHQLALAGRLGTAFKWEMTGNDPQFGVDVSGAGLPPGHYRLLIEFPNGLEALIGPCLYVDSGDGFSDRGRIDLYFTAIGRARSIASFTLPRGARALRFDPSRQPGPVFIGRVWLRRMARTEYYTRLAAGLMRARIRSGADLARYGSRAWQLLAHEGVRALVAQLRIAESRVATLQGDYQRWIKNYDTISEQDQADMRRVLPSFAHQPLISIVMPVYDTPEALLRETIESVLTQTYPNWELCIADDASPSPHVRRLLDRYRAQDQRIKVVYRADNGHIARASNSALELATGEWIALLDHDDLLAPHALFCVVDAINRRPDAQLIYSDEDKVDRSGRRYDVFFKPDFLIDLFRAQNYLNHLTVHRAENVRRAGGFRPGFEGSQDYDLHLRIIETVDPDRIVHVPHVLYHWRAVAGSTALAQKEKGYAWEAGRRALADHLSRRSVAAEVDEIDGVPFYRMKFALPEPQPLVSIIVPMRDRVDIARTSVESLLDRTIYDSYEIIIVDNGSVEDETKAWFAEVSTRANVRVLPFDAPFNFSAINNYAAEFAAGSVLALVNNDIEVISPDWLSEMVSWVAQERVGCVGAKLYYPNGTVQHAGVILGVGGVAGHSHKHAPGADPGYFSRLRVAQGISAVTAACLVVRREVYFQVGGLDAENLAVAFNDVDFCLRVREAGYINVWTPFAELIHHESISRGYEDSPAKIARFQREIEFMKQRWGDALQHDPAYSPNLTLEREDFSIAFPPRIRKPWR